MNKTKLTRTELEGLRNAAAILMSDIYGQGTAKLVKSLEYLRAKAEYSRLHELVCKAIDEEHSKCKHCGK